MPLAERQRFTDIPGGLDILLQWLRDSENSTTETTFRTESMEDYRFYAGDQDYAYVTEILESQNRPTSKYNEVKPKVDMLIGLAAQTRHDIVLSPVGSEDDAMAQLATGVLKHYRTKLKLGRKELDCFEHTVKGGRSLLYFWIDTDNPFKPKICCRRWRSYNFFLDPNSQEYDYSDARYLFLEKWLTEEELKKTFPSVDISQLSAYGAIYSDLPQFFNEARDLYRVVEGWFWKYEDVIWFANPMNGQVECLPPADFEKFLQVLEKGIPQPNGEVLQVTREKVVSQKGVKKVPCYKIFSGIQILKEGNSSLNWEGFPAIIYGAYKNEDTNAWFGAITMMKDPQRSVNTMRRQLSHLLQTLPKGILAHETGAIVNIEEYEERSAEPNFHLEIMPGKFDKFKFVQQPNISPIFAQFDAIASQSMKDASGIQDPLMGIQQSSREAGVTERLRQETGMAVLYLLFSNFQESRHNGTSLLMSLIQQYVTMPEVIRIEGPEGEQLVQINTQLNKGSQGFNDVSAMEFDLVPQDTAETATMRLTTAQILAEVNHNNPGSIPPDVILEYADVPFTVKQRVRSNYESQQAAAQQASERELRIKEIELQLKEREVQVKEKEIILKDKELEIKKLDVVLKNRDRPEEKSKPKKK